jgi:hypothetical protein
MTEYEWIEHRNAYRSAAAKLQKAAYERELADYEARQADAKAAAAAADDIAARIEALKATAAQAGELETALYRAREHLGGC